MEFFEGDSRDPAQMTKPYVQWQRGPLSKTPIEEMTGWIDKSLATGTWLVLVIHGVEGIGWEPVPAARLRAYFDYIKGARGSSLGGNVSGCGEIRARTHDEHCDHQDTRATR